MPNRSAKQIEADSALPDFCSPEPCSYRAPQLKYGAPITRYKVPRTRYSTPQSRHSAPKPRYPTQPPRYSAPPARYKTRPPKYSAALVGYDTPPPAYSARPEVYNTPPPKYSASGYSAPHIGHNALEHSTLLIGRNVPKHGQNYSNSGQNVSKAGKSAPTAFKNAPTAGQSAPTAESTTSQAGSVGTQPIHKALQSDYNETCPGTNTNQAKSGIPVYPQRITLGVPKGGILSPSLSTAIPSVQGQTASTETTETQSLANGKQKIPSSFIVIAWLSILINLPFGKYVFIMFFLYLSPKVENKALVFN